MEFKDLFAKYDLHREFIDFGGETFFKDSPIKIIKDQLDKFIDNKFLVNSVYEEIQKAKSSLNPSSNSVNAIDESDSDTDNDIDHDDEEPLLGNIILNVLYKFEVNEGKSMISKTVLTREVIKSIATTTKDIQDEASNLSNKQLIKLTAKSKCNYYSLTEQGKELIVDNSVFKLLGCTTNSFTGREESNEANLENVRTDERNKENRSQNVNKRLNSVESETDEEDEIANSRSTLAVDDLFYETYADETKEPPKKKRNRNKFIDDLKNSMERRTYFHYPTFFNKLPELNQRPQKKALNEFRKQILNLIKEQTLDLTSCEYEGIAVCLICKYQFFQEKIASGCVSNDRSN